MREAVVAVGGVKLRHRQQVFGDVLRQAACPQLLVAPLLEGHVHVGDRPALSYRILGRHAMPVLGLRAGQFVDLADVAGGARQDGPDHFRDVERIDGRRPSGAANSPSTS